jgi:hypothetical protein
MILHQLGEKCDRVGLAGKVDREMVNLIGHSPMNLNYDHDRERNKLNRGFEGGFAMPNPDPSKSEKSSYEEAVDEVTRLASHIADAIDSESTDLEDCFDELESEIKEADKADQKRRDALEAKREQIREEFAKKWKRY